MNKLCCCIICCATARVGPGKCQRCDKEMELCECGILARCGWVWGRGFVGSLAGHDLPFLVWLSCWFSAAETPQVDLLLLFLCKTWDDTSARLIQSKAFDTLKTVFFFFTVLCKLLHLKYPVWPTMMMWVLDTCCSPRAEPLLPEQLTWFQRCYYTGA